ncbi:MAG: PEP-CTERM sorting domain-containing protein, partial [Verrucomicrobiota bacterium]
SGWTLFIADVSAGGGQSQLTSWGLEINVPTQVPEPGTLALGGVALAGFIARQLWGRQRSRA